jgi:hypothetical protein
LILKDLTSLWAPASLGEGEAIPGGRWGTLRGDFYTEIGESVEFTEGTWLGRLGVRIRFKPQKKDDGLKAAATNSQEEKEIAGIVRAGI